MSPLIQEDYPMYSAYSKIASLFSHNILWFLIEHKKSRPPTPTHQTCGWRGSSNNKFTFSKLKPYFKKKWFSVGKQKTILEVVTKLFDSKFYSPNVFWATFSQNLFPRNQNWWLLLPRITRIKVSIRRLVVSLKVKDLKKKIDL